MNVPYVITLIDDLRDEWYKDDEIRPGVYKSRKKVDFEYHSYARSGMKEIKIYLMKYKDENPIEAIENFRYEMDHFACRSKTGKANFMFSVYYDVASEVLEVLLSMN